MNQQETLSISAMKAKADVLENFLKGKGVSLQRTHILEAVSQMCGYPNWSTARAAASKQDEVKESSKPAPASADGLQSFEIEVCRYGYSGGTVEVRATSLQQARELALDCSEDISSSEYASDYFVIGKGEPYIDEQDADLADSNEGPEITYVAELCNISYGALTLPIRAKNLEEAEILALNQAGNHYFSSSGSRCVVANVYKKN